MKSNILKVRETIINECFYYEIYYLSGLVRYYPVLHGMYRLPKTIKNFMYNCPDVKKIKEEYRTVYIYE